MDGHVPGLRRSRPGLTEIWEIMENNILKKKEDSMSEDRTDIIYGHVDSIEDGFVSGWLMNKLDNQVRCTVVAVNDGQIISETIANLYREDLFSLGIGDGRYAFRLNIPFVIMNDEVEILEKTTGARLIGSPVKIKAAVALSAASRAPVLSGPAAEVLGETAIGGDKKLPETRRNEPVDLVSAIHDVLSKVCSRNNFHGRNFNTGEMTISLAEIYRLPIADAVFFSFKAILGRVPDLNGYRTYVSALRSGAMSRMRLIEVLRCAPEAKHRRVQILHDATERDLAEADRHASRTRVFYSADDFGIKSLAGNEDADAFLPRAYQLVLKREPDPSGIATYREAMAKGATCAQVLASMIDSDEFKKRGEPLVILGVTPGQDVFKTLFNATESMMATIIDLEYQLQSIKNI